MLSKLFECIRNVQPPNSLYEAIKTLILKPIKVVRPYLLL